MKKSAVTKKARVNPVGVIRDVTLTIMNSTTYLPDTTLTPNSVVSVSFALPFAEGVLLNTSALAGIRVYAGGNEIPIYVAATAGNRRDNSIRSVLLQFDVTLDNTGNPVVPIKVAYNIPGSRKFPDLTRRTTSNTSRTILLWTDPQHTLNAKPWGNWDIRNPATSPARKAEVTDMDATFARWRDADWTRFKAWTQQLDGTPDQYFSGGRVLITTCYEFAFDVMVEGLRRSNATQVYRALCILDNHFRGYIIPANQGSYGAREQTTQPAGPVLQYILTGDEEWRSIIRAHHTNIAYGNRYFSMNNTYGHRIRANTFGLMLAGWQIDVWNADPTHTITLSNRVGADITFWTPYVNVIKNYAQGVTDWISSQDAAGPFYDGSIQPTVARGPNNTDLPNTKPYQEGMMMSRLVRMLDEGLITGTLATQAYAAIDKWLDWTFTNTWREVGDVRNDVANVNGCVYVLHDHNASGNPEGGQNSPQPLLNAFLLVPLANRAKRRKEPNIIAWADRALNGLIYAPPDYPNSQAYVYTPKQVEEIFWGWPIIDYDLTLAHF